jgi:hypothetical protein
MAKSPAAIYVCILCTNRAQVNREVSFFKNIFGAGNTSAGESYPPTELLPTKPMASNGI